MNRNISFQTIKGFMMVMIIFGHTYFYIPEFSLKLGAVPSLLIYPLDFLSHTCIPCFFMICGYGFRKRPLHILMRNNVLPILKAYLITSVIILALHALRSYVVGREVLPALLPRILSYVLMIAPQVMYFGMDIEGVGPMWFFCCLAFCSLLLNLILQIPDQRGQSFICLALCWLGNYLHQFPLPFCISQTFLCCGFMYLGYRVRQDRLLEKKLPWYFPAGALLICLLICLKMPHRINFYLNLFPGGAGDIIACYLLGYVLMYYASFLDPLKGRLLDGLYWLGQNSFLVCCAHQVDFQGLPLRTFLLHFSQNELLMDTVLFFIRLALCSFVTWLIILIGRRRLRS